MELRRNILLLGLLSLVSSLVGAALGTTQSSGFPPLNTKPRPNILFILTDDQDMHMDSLKYMPHLHKHIGSRGLSFRRHFCTVALCCPSRGNLWSGQAAHNTNASITKNVTDLSPPYGGYPKWIERGYNDRWIPVWLQAAGYSTYYVGKLFNSFSIQNYNKPFPKGWTGSDFLLDPYTYCYLNATFQRNRDPPISYGNGNYSTDVVAAKAMGFLNDALDTLERDDRPFFLTVAPASPHSDVCPNQAPPIPAERHKSLFNETVVPRTPNFNPEKSSGAQWIKKLQRQTQTNVDYNDSWYRNRLRALQSVDEMIDALMTRLEVAGVLDNTYVFFSTDNGYHIGQHRMQPGKQCAVEEDLNIPFLVRGPGVPENTVTDLVTSFSDLAPTLLNLAGAPLPIGYTFDGQAIPVTSPRPYRIHDTTGQKAAESDRVTSALPHNWRQEHVNVEQWGIIIPEGKYNMFVYQNITYKAMRVIGESYNVQYTVWCTGEHELYDLNSDPYEMNNLALVTPPTPWSFSRTGCVIPGLGCSSPSLGPADLIGSNGETLHVSVKNMMNRLNALLLLLKDCKGEQCSLPWNFYFPPGQVSNLAQALDPRYDRFFDESVAKIDMPGCTAGYMPELEGPGWNSSQVYGMMHEVSLQGFGE